MEQTERRRITWTLVWTDTLQHPPYMTFTANTNDIICYRKWMVHVLHIIPKYTTTATYIGHIDVTVTTGNEKFRTYRTIQSLGLGRTYSECDNIPRFEITGPVTEVKTSTVTVTRAVVTTTWNLASESGPHHANGTATRRPQPPSCNLSGDVCNWMWTERTQSFTGNIIEPSSLQTIPPRHVHTLRLVQLDACKMRFCCFTGLRI